MKATFHRIANWLISLVVVISMLFPGIQPQPVSAQEPSDGLLREYNAETGKVSLITGADHAPLAVLGARAAGMTPEAQSLALVQRFASEFGLTRPSEELLLSEIDQPSTERVVSKYQQMYQGVPVMAGELIVHASKGGTLLSMNGEVSPGLILDTNPKLTAETAIEIAKEGMVKWYGGDAKDYASAQPALWIFDESLLKPSARPAVLVWRLEMTSTQQSAPIRELVLVDAKTGNVSLHFNQVDTAWGTASVKQDTPPVSITSKPESWITPYIENDSSLDKKEIQPLAPINYYVNIATGNDSNSCTSIASPCQHIQETINKASSGDIINVASGVYYPDSGTSGSVVGWGGKNINLVGGWNDAFSVQNGITIVDGMHQKRGISINGSTSFIDRLWIRNGLYAYGGGGGIYFLNSNITITNTTISNNWGGSLFSPGGGGIKGENSKLSLINSTVSENNTDACGGGGISITTNGQVLIQNSTITMNSLLNAGSGCDVGGVVVNNSIGYTGSLIIRNSIMAKNTNVDCATSSTGITKNSNGFNILGQNNSNSSYDCLPVGAGDLVGVDPFLGRLNPITGINYLTPGSPALDAGSPLSPGSDPGACVQTDQAGRLRPIDGNNDGSARCDIGAFESDVPTPSVISAVEVFSGSPQIVKTSGSTSNPLIAMVVDQYGLPRQGVTVTFTAPGSGASGIFSDTGTNTTTAITNVNGKANASAFTANNNAGSYIVVATISGIATPAEFKLENQVSIPTTITVSSGSNQSAHININFANPVAALVKDQFGNPMAGIAVSFIAPATGASSVFFDTGTNTTSAITNASGIATSSAFAANAINGFYAINATVSGVSLPAVFQLTNSVVICAIINQSNYHSLLFKPYKEFRCGSSDSMSYGIGSGDFNGDGRQDIALSYRDGVGPKHILLIFLQNIDGSYPANPISYAGGNRSEHLAVGDLNNDGRLDVATADFSDNTISVYLQLGNGTIAKRLTYTTGNGPDAMAIEDINNDGLDDIVVSHLNSTSIGVFTQKNDGSLNLMATYPSVASEYGDVAIGDVNNDGRNDVVKLNGQSSINTSISVFLQSAGGNLENSILYSLGCNCLGKGVDVGDVTGDGRKDVVMSYGGNQPNSFVAVFSQDINGLLQIPISYNVYDFPSPVKIVDINSDGKSDVITAHNGFSSNIGMLAQNNSGQLGSYTLLTVPYKLNYYSQDLGIKDLNNDALPDILLAGIQGPIIYYRQMLPITGGNRQTYTSNNTTSLPGTFLCDQSAQLCTNQINLDADYAHAFAGQAWSLYNNRHNRNSIDNQGMTIISSIQYGSGYQNAFWNGTQMVYGNGFSGADDVVAHELTHGVTQYESNLFYFYQSGAINESFSDLWGEMFDQQNGLGRDAGLNWYIGEDLPSSSIRNMSNPPTYGDPDKMTSANYDKTDLDNGGVHTNSGVNNKAVFLMVDGGTFNGKTVSALGWDKTAAIYYEAQTNLLSSGADYSDLYFALQQACINKTGQLGITAADCTQMKNALDAVEMNSQPVANFNPDAPVCAAGLYASPVFEDTLESGSGKWMMTGAWSLGNGYASSPTHMLYGDDFYPSAESIAEMTTGVVLPPATNHYLHFKHAFGFEYDVNGNYDGGVLEYSTNNGSTWVDASPLFVDGQNYKGIITNYNGTTNALKGRSGFVGDSHGYVSSRYNLTSLAGQTVKFRWRFATDNSYYYLGWLVDDVQIYTCGTTPTYPTVASSVRSNNNPTSAASANFTVTFSENVSGVDAGDFTLTTTGGVSGAAVSGVSGSGSVYTVTVNTGSGDGTIRLNVVDNNSIADATGNLLGGDAMGDGNFTTGEAYTISKKIPPINFSDQLFHTSNPPTVVTIPNTHGTDIHIGTLLGSASVGTTWNTAQDFFIENDTCSGATVIPSGSCTFKVRFLPWSLGAKSGTITVPSDAPDQPYIVALSGNSIAGTQLLTNRSFDSYSAVTNLPDLWTVSPGIKVGIDTVDSSWAFNGPLSFKFVGDGDLKILSQTINKAGVAGDDFSFNVMTKGAGIPVNAQRWLLQVMFLNNGVTVENRNIPLTTGTFSNVRLTRMYTAVSSYNQILFRIHYGKSSGTAWVDLANLQWAP